MLTKGLGAAIVAAMLHINSNCSGRIHSSSEVRNHSEKPVWVSTAFWRTINRRKRALAFQ